MEFYISVVDCLRYKSCIAVVSSFWNQPHICRYIKNVLFKKNRPKRWSDIEEHVVFSIENNTFLPDILKSKLKNFVQPMGKQILRWIFIAESSFKTFADSDVNITFVWSAKGVLDFQKTAEVVIRFNSTYLLLCFCLACKFCIQDIVYELEPFVLLDLHETPKGSEFVSENSIVEFWLSSLHAKRLRNANMSDAVNAMSVEDIIYGLYEEVQNVPVLGYFFEKMSDDKRREILHTMLESIRGKTRPRDGLMLIYLLSKCQQSVANSYLENNAYKVLSCLLEWSCLELFLPTLNRLWNHLSNINYLHLTVDIAECISEFQMTSDYQNIFHDFWKPSPQDFKDYIYLKCTSGTFLSRIFCLQNTDGIMKIIFNDTTPEVRQQMIFYFGGMNLCDYLVKINRWDSLKMFVQSCIPSIEVMNEFVEMYRRYEPSYLKEENQERTFRFCLAIKNWF